MYAFVVLVVTFITYWLADLVPGDAAQAILGQQATAKQVNALSHQLGLDRPISARYGDWLMGLFHGNLGTSVITHQSIAATLNQRLPVTLALVIGATLVAVIVGLFFGIVSAIRNSHRSTRLVDAGSVAGLAIPNFWLAILLVAAFAVSLPVFPASGYVSPGQSVGGWLRSLVLPVVALAAAAITLIAKQSRDQMLATLDSRFIRMLRANGASETSIVLRHALRNAALPTMTVIGLTFVAILGGTVFVETVFALPGLGSALVHATETHDLVMLQGISLYFIVAVVIVNALTDLSYSWLNPRARRTR
jgi:peptide/nickel transport system permease protein